MAATNLDDLPKIGAPATRALNNAGYRRLSQLAGVSRSDLAKLHGGQVAAELVQRRTQRGGQGVVMVVRLVRAIRVAPLADRVMSPSVRVVGAVCLVIGTGRALRARDARPAHPPGDCSHGQSVTGAAGAGKRDGTGTANAG